MIYFDNAATTRALPTVVEKVSQCMLELYGNPASVSQMGLLADKEIRQTTDILAQWINCRTDEVYYTSGGTEGDNWAIFGTAKGYHRQGNHFITTAIEHPAVRNPLKKLEEEGCDVTWLGVDEKGYIDVDALIDAIAEGTVLVSVILVNNETGVIQDVTEIGRRIKEKNPKTLFHVDAVQAFGKYPIDVAKMKIDLLTMSGHKIHGPKGVGMLYMRKGLRIMPLLFGGGQQGGQRGGTDNVPGIAGLGVAAKESFLQLQKGNQTVLDVKKTLAEGILHKIPNTRINGEGIEKASPFVLNMTFDHIRSEVLLHALESRGIIVSAGSACDSKKKIGSPVLTAMGLPFSQIEGAIRFSFSRYNTVEEALHCVETLEEVVAFLRKYNR